MQCHGMYRLSFRNLAEPGGPGFSVRAAAAVAAGSSIRRASTIRASRSNAAAAWRIASRRR